MSKGSVKRCFRKYLDGVRMGQLSRFKYNKNTKYRHEPSTTNFRNTYHRAGAPTSLLYYEMIPVIDLSTGEITQESTRGCRPLDKLLTR